MIKAVIFDYGGVVMPIWWKSREDIAAAFGVSVEAIHAFFPSLVKEYASGKCSEFQFWKSLATKINKPIPDNYQSIWRLHNHEWSIYQDIVRLVKNLSKHGIITAILSNTIDAHSETTKQNDGFKFFDRVFLSHDLGLYKPDREIYQYVLKELNLSGSECIFIDDIEKNLPPAESLGIKTILARNPTQVISDVHKLIPNLQ